MADEDNLETPIPVTPVEAAAAPPLPPAPYAAPVQPSPAPYGQAYAPQPAGPAQGLSIASMVCGIAGIVLALFWVGFLPALAAVITGHLASRRQPYAKPFWLTGIITGYVGLGISLIYFAVIVIFVIIGVSASQYNY